MNSYPLSANHFSIEWGGKRIGASEISGLSINMQPINYSEGSFKANAPIVMPGQQKANTIVLKRGIMQGDNEFYEWLKSVKGNTVERRDLTISLLNENHEPVVTWKLKNAFPVKMEWTDLKAHSNEPAMELLEIVHEGMTVENGG